MSDPKPRYLAELDAMSMIYRELRTLTVDETGRALEWVVARLNSERPKGDPEISVFVGSPELIDFGATCTECHQPPGDDCPHFVATGNQVEVIP